MSRTQPATRAQSGDFWPSNSLASWADNPKETFLVWLAQQRVLGIRHFRETTRETYAAMFNAWLDFLAKSKLSLLEASDKDVTLYFQNLELQPVSRRRYLQLLDKVYIHLIQLDWQRSNPIFAELKKEIELDVSLPEGLDKPEIVELEAALAKLSGWKGIRDRGLAALLLGAGLRANEVIAMPLANIDNFDIKVEPSGVHREHTTLILPDGPWRGWYLSWLEERARLKIPGGLVTPATLSGKPYTRSGLYRRINTWFDQANVTSTHQGPNVLRNTFARSALTCERYSLEQVQEFLGHEESRATSRHNPAAA